MTIVYVDDDEDDIYLFTELLREIDPNIPLLSYTNSIEALDFLRQTPILPDFIFMDMNMPLMNGLELLGLLKQDHRLKSIKIIMYSTSKSESEIAEVYARGAFRFIKKASTITEAKAHISTLLFANS